MSMPTIFIHVGRHKTASSAIQRFLALNAEKLKSQGFLFPRSFRTKGGNPADGHHDFANKLVTSVSADAIDVLKDEFLNSKLQFCIVSAERLGTFWFEHERDVLKKNIALIKKDFDVRLVIYLRRQDDLLNSWWNQRTRIGVTTSDIETFFSQNKEIFDHRPILEFWRDLLTKENLRVRKFGKQEHVGVGIYKDFLECIGLKFSKDLIVPEQELNPSLDLRLLQLLLEVQNELSDSQRKDLLRTLLRVNSLIPREARATAAVSQDLRSEVMRTFEESNTWITKQFFDSKKSLF